MFRKISFVLVLFIVCACYASDDDTYIAAVAEYSPITNYNPNITKEGAQAVMLQNVKAYEQLVSQASKKGAQIIVFPEYGLYGPDFETRESIYPFLEAIPDANAVSLCNKSYANSLPVTYHLSCIARSYNIVLVVNMGDVVLCNDSDNDCPADGRFQYNTDVVFSETGSILAKYHKSHLYFEPNFDQPASPDPTTFTTSFGVTFGVFICFDIMFPYPQLDYTNAGITNIVFSTLWVNTPPYFSALQVQVAWSRALNANLLASGIGSNYFSSGSGIYSAGTPLAEYFNPTWNAAQAVLVTTLSKKPLQKNPLPNFTEQEGVNPFGTGSVGAGDQFVVQSFVAHAGASGSLTVSSGNLTCTASYSISNTANAGDTYALEVLNGNYNGLFYGQICALVLCPNGTCIGQPSIEATTVFTSFHMEGNFSSQARLYSAATTNEMFLAPASSYTSDGARIGSTDFGIPLLSATIFGVVW